MKKILILALCFSVSFAFNSCTSCTEGVLLIASMLDTPNEPNDNDKNKSIPKYYSSYQEACKDGAFEKAHEKLENIHESFVSYPLTSSYYLQKAREYFSALDYIYKAEIQYIVTNMDDEACKDKLTFLLAEIPIDGQKPDKSFSAGSYAFEVEHSDKYRDFDYLKPIKVYGYYVTSYNKLLDYTLTLAINRKHKKLAKGILLQYIDDLDFVQGADSDYKAVYSKSSYNAAKEKYNQAVSMQLFE